MTLRFTVTIGVILLMSGCTGLPDGIEPVAELDLDRYQGTWYEIARLDHSFEEGLSNVTAHYSLNKDGSVTVTNRGFSADNDGWQEAEGHAVPMDNAPSGHLKVSFFGPFYASYVVFHLSENYQTAFVTGYNRDYLWLLSRTPTISETALQAFLSEAGARGFALDELILVDQNRSSSSQSGSSSR